MPPLWAPFRVGAFSLRYAMLPAPAPAHRTKDWSAPNRNGCTRPVSLLLGQTQQQGSATSAVVRKMIHIRGKQRVDNLLQLFLSSRPWHKGAVRSSAGRRYGSLFSKPIGLQAVDRCLQAKSDVCQLADSGVYLTGSDRVEVSVPAAADENGIPAQAIDPALSSLPLMFSFVSSSALRRLFIRPGQIVRR